MITRISLNYKMSSKISRNKLESRTRRYMISRLRMKILSQHMIASKKTFYFLRKTVGLSKTLSRICVRRWLMMRKSFRL